MYLKAYVWDIILNHTKFLGTIRATIQFSWLEAKIKLERNEKANEKWCYWKTIV